MVLNDRYVHKQQTQFTSLNNIDQLFTCVCKYE